MSQQLPEEWFVRDARVNAAIAWVLTAILVVVAVLSLLSGLLVIMALTAVAAAVALVPALVHRSWTRTVPWPLLLLASLPLLVGAFQPSFLLNFLDGVAVAALAILVVVALQLTTSVRMTPMFAIAFVFVTTLATAGFWAVGSAVSARYLGTAFVETNEQLMMVFSAAVVSGVVAGLVFRWYFRRQLRQEPLGGIFEEVETA